MKKTYYIIAAVYVVSLLISAFAGYQMRKPETVYVDVPRTVTDTVYVYNNVVQYKYLPAKHDTVWNTITKTVTDTLQLVPSQVAYVDTVLRSDTQVYGNLSVAYYPYPWDRFNVQFKPAPMPTITITKYVDKKRSWYEHPAFTAALGIAAGAVAHNQTR